MFKHVPFYSIYNINVPSFIKQSDYFKHLIVRYLLKEDRLSNGQ